ncbi:MAG: hypothetical protein ACYDCF_08905, partial [Burkholderiales bacterium]
RLSAQVGPIESVVKTRTRLARKRRVIRTDMTEHQFGGRFREIPLILPKEFLKLIDIKPAMPE